MSDRVHVHAICFNEMRLLPYFLRHYAFADRIFIHDNLSTDGTREYLKEQPAVTLVDYDSGGELRDDLHLQRKDHDWKISRGAARWVIVCDIDELVYHPDLPGILDRLSGEQVSLVRTDGWQMVAERFPSSPGPLTGLVRSGYRHRWYSKAAVFRPDLVDETHYGPGCHTSAPVFRGRMAEGSIRLLHYSHVGREETWQRLSGRRDRLSDVNIRNGWGLQYQMSRQVFDRKFDRMLAKACQALP